jgi:hypothetical protein
MNIQKSLNELLLERGYAVVYQDFCGISEFSSLGSKIWMLTVSIDYKLSYLLGKITI